ncbi:hypothetical protein [Nocardia asiatica]|uniref:hypothetical protein n=1 Tax=Nocardia asiatica TaxID=209252 RepID=UPI00245388F3|nr:hypothetical protein [Nocardia asiatica]
MLLFPVLLILACAAGFVLLRGPRARVPRIWSRALAVAGLVSVCLGAVLLYNSAIEADERGVSASETMLWWEYAVFVAGLVCTVSACFVALLWRRR